MSQPSNAPNGQPRFWQHANLAVFLMQTLATSIQVFIRGGFGARYLGLNAAAVLVVVPLFFAFKRVTDFGEIGFYLTMYVAMCCLHNHGVKLRLKRGEVWHSYYDGQPVLQRFFPRLKCSEVTFKRWFEPCLVIGAGLLWAESNEPIGTYLMLCGASIACLTHFYQVQEATRLNDLNDSILDQQALAERLRESRGDRI
jgi:hypothetical protein